MTVEFRVLGDIEVRIDGRVVTMGRARQLCVLMALVHDIGTPVPVEQVLRRAWGEVRPQAVRNALHGCLWRLRRELGEAAGVSIVREPGGYVLTGDAGMVDLHRFRRLVAEARTAEDARAAELFARAFALWRGKPFGGLTNPWIGALRATLETERFAAVLDRNDVELRLARHHDLPMRMRDELAAHPLDERLAGQVILALLRCGRSADADRCYQDIRRRLAEELGVDPTPRLRELLAVPSSPAPVPRQLPAHTPHFVGRDKEIVALDDVLRSRSGQAAVVAISGPAGVGKTTLAVHWAHRVQSAFPDGQMYVNLRGFDHTGAVVPSSEALRGLLFALGVPPTRMPAELDAQSALYRSIVGERRMLVVLDNARDVEQIRPLLPGPGDSMAVVTSRARLSDLVTRVITVRPLGGHDARELLERHLGCERIAAEPSVVDELVERSGSLPLALAVLASRAALTPAFPLRALADELTNEQARLDIFDGDDPDTNVRAAISWSCRQLGPAAARMFRFLGAHPGPDFARPATASLAGMDLATASAALDELMGVHLVEEIRPGRYTLHDLVRVYAAELSRSVDDEDARADALRRLLDHYLHTAKAAALLLRPMRPPITPSDPLPGTIRETLTDYAQAWDWFEAEAAVLGAVIRRAAAAGFDDHVWQLSWTLADYFDRKGHWHDWTELGEVALAAGRRLRDQGALASTHRGLGQALILLRSFEDAESHLKAALELEIERADLVAQAGVLRGLALLADTRGRYEEALDYGDQALAISVACADRAGEAAALNQVGWYHCRLGRHAQALLMCERSLVRHRELGDWTAEAVTWDSLGYVHHQMGHGTQAVECYLHALDLYRELGDLFEEAATLDRLADAYRADENVSAAEDALRRAVGILDTLRHPDVAETRAKLGDLVDQRRA